MAIRNSRSSKPASNKKSSYSSNSKTNRSTSSKSASSDKSSSYGKKPSVRKSTSSYSKDSTSKSGYSKSPRTSSSSYGEKKTYSKDSTSKTSYSKSPRSKSSNYGDDFKSKPSRFGDKKKFDREGDDKKTVKRESGSKDYSTKKPRLAREFKTDKPSRFGDKKAGFKKTYSEDDKPKKTYSKSYEKKDFSEQKPARRSPRQDDDKPKSYGTKKSSYSDYKSSKFGDKKESKYEKPTSYGNKKSKYDSDSKLNTGRYSSKKSEPKKSSRNDDYIDEYDPTDKKSYGPDREFNKNGRRVTKRYVKSSDDWDDKPKTKVYSKSTSKKRKVKEEKEDDGLVRLNKYIANAGICSRREADEFIATGVVKVNGEIVTELGYKVNPNDKIQFGEKTIKGEKNVYVLLNKPKDFITSSKDPQNRRTVLDLVAQVKERIFPVGRLDRNTTGVLLLTNDGEMADKLMHPRRGVVKIYHAVLDKKFSFSDLETLRAGVELEDGFFQPDEVHYADGLDKHNIGIEIHSGKNRIVRRMFEALGYTVVKLDRVIYAGLTKKGLTRGKWRFLTEQEVNALKMLK